jgi:hypothetical protein
MPGTEKALKLELPSYLWRKNCHRNVPRFSTAYKKFSISQKSKHLTFQKKLRNVLTSLTVLGHDPEKEHGDTSF